MATLRYINNSRTGEPGTLVELSTPLQFYDDDMYIYASADGTLDIVSDSVLNLTAPTIALTGSTALTFSGPQSFDDTITIAITTDAATAKNGLKCTITTGLAHTGNVAGIRSYVTTDNTGDNIANMFALMGKASLIHVSDSISGTLTGLLCQIDLGAALYASTGTAWGLCIDHNDTSSNRAKVPRAFIRFEDKGYAGNAPTEYLFDIGGTSNNCPNGTGKIYYNNTLHLRVNANDGYIPLSSAQGTFTTAYPIVTSYATTAIDISTCTTGIDITGATTGINLNGTMTTAITIGDGATTGVSITGASGYAIDIQATGHFRMGTGPSGTEVGIPVTTATPHNMEVYTEPGATPLTAYTSSFGIRSRYLIDNAQTQIITVEAVDARMRIKKALTQGIYTGVQGYIEVSGSPTLNATQIHAGGFTVEVGAGTTLSGGYICGVHIDSATADSVSVASVTYAALRISTGTSSKEIWTHGIYMGNNDAVTGITMGTCTTGISLSGTYTNALSINGTMANPAISDGSAMGCQVEATMTGTSTGMFAASSSWANVNGTTGANWVIASTNGIWENAGSTGVVSSGVLIFGMRMQAILTNTDFGRLCPFALNVPTGTVSALFSVGNTNLGGDCGYVEAVTESDAPIGYVPLLIDSNGTKYYVRVYADTD